MSFGCFVCGADCIGRSSRIGHVRFTDAVGSTAESLPGVADRAALPRGRADDPYEEHRAASDFRGIAAAPGRGWAGGHQFVFRHIHGDFAGWRPLVALQRIDIVSGTDDVQSDWRRELVRY